MNRAPPLAWAGLLLARPLVMGILNVTPDSFSDGGQHATPEAAIAAGAAMLEAGAGAFAADVDDIRPGAAPISPAQEMARILPAISALAAQGAVISVDTRNAATMAAALDAGAR
ncbi:dihydropteroate synthase, partial [Acidocella sp.]|uniref:dihydropteroate synthase n=1 Tax=Acidocella sp. TaxID=50710 RepID=UPI0018194DC3